jgi:hypothetical protein
MTGLLGEISSPAVPQAGDGLLSVIYFVPDPVAPDYEETPGSPLDCKAWDLTPEEFVTNLVGVDVGTVQWTIPDGPVMPPCTYVDGRGYACIGVSGTGGDIAVVDAGNGIYSLTDANVTFGAAQVGRYLEISGADAGNNGAFPIVDSAGDNTVIFVNPGGSAEANTNGTYQTVAGMGPAGQDDPLPENTTVSFEVTANADAPIESFTDEATVPSDFTLDDASMALLYDTPLTGDEFTIGCAGAGGDCGSAQASILRVLTTDADVTGLPPNAMPPPDAKAVLVQCIVPLTGAVTVSAEASAILMNSGATRVQTVFLRATPTTDPARPWLTLLAPHMQAGNTTP